MLFDAETCWHEACHAVVARELSFAVTEFRVDRPGDGLDGHVLTSQDRMRMIEMCAVAEAPEIWFRGCRADVDPRSFAVDRRMATRWIHSVGLTTSEVLAARRLIERTPAEALDRRRTRRAAGRIPAPAARPVGRRARMAPTSDTPDDRKGPPRGVAELDPRTSPCSCRTPARSGPLSTRRGSDGAASARGLRHSLAEMVRARVITPLDADRVMLSAATRFGVALPAAN
jgi:hypothetical protein